MNTQYICVRCKHLIYMKLMSVLEHERDIGEGICMIIKLSRLRDQKMLTWSCVPGR